MSTCRCNLEQRTPEQQKLQKKNKKKCEPVFINVLQPGPLIREVDEVFGTLQGYLDRPLSAGIPVGPLACKKLLNVYMTQLFMAISFLSSQLCTTSK